jgi:hypothetical protein
MVLTSTPSTLKLCTSYQTLYLETPILRIYKNIDINHEHMSVIRHFKGAMRDRLNHHQTGRNQVFQDKFWIADQDCCFQILSTVDVGMPKVSHVSFLGHAIRPAA